MMRVQGGHTNRISSCSRAAPDIPDTAAAELRPRRTGTGLGVDTRTLGRPSTSNVGDARWKDWSVGFGNYAGLVNTRLTTLLPQTDLTNDQIKVASLELIRFDLSGDLLSTMEEHGRAVLMFHNVSEGEISSAIKVGMVWKESMIWQRRQRNERRW